MRATSFGSQKDLIAMFSKVFSDGAANGVMVVGIHSSEIFLFSSLFSLFSP
jgi:hypothetical protein